MSERGPEPAPQPKPRRPRLLADLSPLREFRDFRFLFFGNAISYLGRQMTVVAIPFQVYVLTDSSLAVGMTGLVSLGPLVVMSLVGGAVADAVDRRKLLLVAVLAQAATAVALAVNASSDHPALWPLYVLGALNAGLWGIDLPTRNAMVASMVSREKFPAAASLSQIIFELSQVAGPAMAGIVISQVDLAAAYWIDAASYVFALAAVIAIKPRPPEGGGTRAGLGSIKEGLAFAIRNRLILSTFLIDINAMVFGMPRALFPAIGTTVYGGGATAVGLLFAAPGAGALVGALFTGWVGRVRFQGRVVIVAVLLWGAGIAAFGVVTWLPLGLFLLAFAGAADVVSAVFRNTILQLNTPDSLRGRLSSVHIAVVTGGPALGDAEAGAVAAFTSPRTSVVSGGLACMLGVALLARFFPELARYDAAKEVVPDG